MNNYNKLVIFDCDGTLVDSQHLIVRAMHDTFEEAGLPPVTSDNVRAIVGLSLEDAIRHLLPEMGADQHRVLAEKYKGHYYHLRVEVAQGPDPLYEGTRAALEALSEAGFLLGVATGNSMRGLTRILEEHDLADFFVTLQTADGHPSKPHPSMIHTAIADAGAAPETTIMVGDTSYDMLMARDAGSMALGVNWGYHAEEDLLRAGAHHIAKAYGEVPQIIGKWTARK